MKLPSDHQQRHQALDPEQSFAVSAPAGSGKTGLLTLRVLTLLARCNHPEEVVCITFTRKAAAEMRERIINTILSAASSPRPEEPHAQTSWDLAQKVLQHDKAKQWQLLKNPQRLRVQTIDGLCRSLTLLNPISSTIGGSTKMLENPRLAYRKAAQMTLQTIESDHPLQEDLSELFLHFDNNKETIVNLLVSLLARRDQWLESLLASREGNARSYFEEVLEELIEETLESLSALLQPLSSDLCLLADYAATNCQVDNPDSNLCQLQGIKQLPAATPSSVPLWLALSDLLLTKSGDWRKSAGLTKNSGFPAGSDKESKALCKHRKMQMSQLVESLRATAGILDHLKTVRYLPPATYENQQWRLLDNLTRILPFCVSQLKWVFRQLNATDFSEITQGALMALGDEDDPTELNLLLDYQIQHILVDEFQDTSTPQLRLLERLTSGWQPGDGRTLFIVGDGMQSCYGFRDANVGLFLDARQTGIGHIELTPLDLSVNFRSCPGVVNWVNRAFQNAFPESDDISRGAVSYSASEAFKSTSEAANDDAVQVHLLVDKEGHNRLPEAEKVAELVEQSLNQQPLGKVAILVRTRPQLNAILPALQRRRISWQATDIEPLSSRMTIIDLLSLTRALLNIADRNAWLALLRTPWIGMDNSDLLIIANYRPEVSPEESGRPAIFTNLQRFQQLPGLSQQGSQILQRSLPLLQLCWNNRRRKGLRHTIEGLWVALGGPACLLNNADMRNADDFFKLLEQHDHGGSIKSWEEFEYAVQQLYARPDTGDNIQVEVMTIHKSKGLEFETVIIPGLDKTSRGDDRQLLLWQQRINRQHQKRLLLSPLSPTGEDLDPLYHYLREEQKLKASLESTRLFYVGCTRAIKQLHLVAQLTIDAKEQPKSPAAGALLTPIWPAIKEQAIYTDAISSKVEPDRDLRGIIRRLPPTWQRQPMVPSSLLNAYRGMEFDDDDNQVNDDYFRHRQSRHLGTVLHRTLAQVSTTGPSTWTESRIQQQQPFWLAQLRGLGLLGQSLTEAANQVELGLRRTLGDPKGCWILDPCHPQAESEASYWTAQSQYRNSIIDRTFIDKGIRWVIDYKSSTPVEGQSLGEFLNHEKEIYASQMQRYRELFSAAGEARVRTALYFPLLSQFTEIIA